MECVPAGNNLKAQGEGTTEREEEQEQPGSRDQERPRDKRENGTGAEEGGTKAREYSVGELTWGVWPSI